MTINDSRYNKRTEAAEVLGSWVKENTSFRPSAHAERDAGIAATIAGHNVRVMEGMAILGDINSSPVRFHIDQAPGVYVEVRRDAALNPNVGLITRLENQIVRLPQTVVKQEQKIAEARQEYRDAATALREPFKHEAVLKSARWEVERIGREMRGEDAPQPTFDADLEALRRSQRADFPVPAGQQPRTSNLGSPTDKAPRFTDSSRRRAMER